MVEPSFFAREPLIVAQALLGKILRHKYKGVWLSAKIIETEAYYKTDKASHSSLGYTESRKALFMQPGTIYMYYARGGDSLNISCLGEGNAVLIKSAIAFLRDAHPQMLSLMQQLNPGSNQTVRPIDKLCSGQTLLCRALNLKVPCWNKQTFSRDSFYLEDVHYQPQKIIQTKRLGIPLGRDEHLLYRFIDYDYVKSCSDNPLTKRQWQPGIDYIIHEQA